MSRDFSTLISRSYDGLKQLEVLTQLKDEDYGKVVERPKLTAIVLKMVSRWWMT